jgi:hypothetical protein
MLLIVKFEKFISECFCKFKTLTFSFAKSFSQDSAYSYFITLMIDMSHEDEAHSFPIDILMDSKQIFSNCSRSDVTP